jgi:phosphatidylserine decarboxylase
MTSRSWHEARRYILTVSAAAVVLLLGRRRSGGLLLGAAGLIALFFRDPERSLERDPRAVYAAADGVVTAVEPSSHEPWMPEQRAVRISTFLGLQNVHVNRSPVTGKVSELESLRGGFAPALLARAQDNTRTRIAIDGDLGPVVVVQVAGLLARKISSWVSVNERVTAGQRIGMIHFGSRTDVLLPVGATDVLVTQGTRVRAGITPIARYRNDA